MQPRREDTVCDFMKQSCLFKCWVITGIIFFITTIVLWAFVLPNVQCAAESGCHSGIFTVECYSSQDVHKCCRPNYIKCGDNSDCTPYPQSVIVCVFLVLIVIGCAIVCVVCIIAVLIMWCVFMKRANSPEFNQPGNYFVVQPQQPYYHQPQPQQQYNQPQPQQQYNPPQPYNPEQQRRNYMRVEPSASQE